MRPSACSSERLLETLDVGKREHRAVDAYVLVVDLAVAALAHTALHAALEVDEDVLAGNADHVELADHEPIEDRRPADDRARLGRELDLGEESRDDADVAGPCVVALVDGFVVLDAVPAAPAGEIVREELHAGLARAVEEDEAVELLAAVEDVLDQAPRGTNADAAGHDEHILSAELGEVEAVPQRSAHVDRVALLQPGDRVGNAAQRANDQVKGVGARRRAREADGDLPVAKERELDDLAGRELHGPAVSHPQREVCLGRGRLQSVDDRRLAGQEDVLYVLSL